MALSLAIRRNIAAFEPNLPENKRIRTRQAGSNPDADFLRDVAET
jgi:hypothetical protein